MSPVPCCSGATGATRAAAAAAAAARLSARRCAAQPQTPLRAPASGRRRAHRQPCAAVSADGQSAVCPVGVTQVHATEPPTGLPNLALRPVSEVAVSSSKALEAFRASGAANRACPANSANDVSPAGIALTRLRVLFRAPNRLRERAEEQYRGHRAVGAHRARGDPGEAGHCRGPLAGGYRPALRLPPRRGGCCPQHLQPDGDLLRRPLL